MGGEPQGTAGSEGGTAHSLEGDDIDAVGRGLEVDQVERTSQGQGGRPGAVDMERRGLLVLLGELAGSSLTSGVHQDWLVSRLLEPEGRTPRTSGTSSGLRNHGSLHDLVHGGDGGLHLRPLLLLHQLLHTDTVHLLHRHGLLCSGLLTFGPGHFTGIRLGLLC